MVFEGCTGVCFHYREEMNQKQIILTVTLKEEATSDQVEAVRQSVEDALIPRAAFGRRFTNVAIDDVVLEVLEDESSCKICGCSNCTGIIRDL